MTKWYESNLCDEGVVISSRVRLARNLTGFPFSERLSDNPKLSAELTKLLINAVKSERTPIGKDFEHICFTQNNEQSGCLLEKHCISPEFYNKPGERNLLLSSNEAVSLMINEEDHLRIQTICAGDNIDESYFLAGKLDDLIEESVDYAFDKEYGYLTACPTNAGTGLRASYMLHLPALEMSGKLGGVFAAASKLGMVARGIHGEGSESQGSIYQISNQVTLGKTEGEIMALLKNVGSRIIEQETELRERYLSRESEFEDRVYRSYGVLRYARRLSSKEAMSLLSDLRMGIISGRLSEKRPGMKIYNIMLAIQPKSLQIQAGRALDDNERDIERASFIRNLF